jgi:hypothetical protein
MKLDMRPAVYCPACRYALAYLIDADSGEIVLHHANYSNGCEHAGKRFAAPTVEVEELAASEHE